MGKGTKIEWCDDTVNGQMGCDGCELSSRHGSGTCYAEILTARRAGTNTGWPDDFYSPKLFPGRIEAACRWADLTGTKREGKPWLDGHPRTIFLDDLGDTFTPSLPIDWLAPLIPMMAASPHRWLFLTKWPQRMQAFFRQIGSVPENFLLGTSLTDGKSVGRLRSLSLIPDALKWVSYEPAIAYVDLSEALTWLSWVVLGGESGPVARPFRMKWLAMLEGECDQLDVPLFVKQLGSVVTWGEYAVNDPTPRMADAKGGDWTEWPEWARIRKMPAYEPRGQRELLA